jgi:hypothetical protein
MAQTQEATTKVGSTPEPVEDRGSKAVHQVAELKLVAIEFTDGHGVRTTRTAVVGPGDQVFFLEDKMVGKQAQTWLTIAVLEKLKR